MLNSNTDKEKNFGDFENEKVKNANSRKIKNSCIETLK